MEKLALYVGPVAGTSYYPRGWDALGCNASGVQVTFKRDPQNQYDKRATGIYYGDTQIGWVPKANNTAIAYALDNGIQVRGRIVKHDRSGAAETRLFVAIYSAAEDKAAAELKTILKAMYGNQWMQGQYPIFARIPSRFMDLVECDLDYLVKSLSSSTRTMTINPVAARAFGSKVAEAAQAADFFSITNPVIKKESSLMSMIDTIIEKNKQTATSAGFMEAGRIANNQLVKLATPHLPLIARGYLNTPLGKLVVANLAQLGAAKFRPGDQRLAKLTSAMMVQGWQEVFEDFDIEQMVEQLLSNSAIKKALDHLDASDDTTAAPKAAAKK